MAGRPAQSVRTRRASVDCSSYSDPNVLGTYSEFLDQLVTQTGSPARNDPAGKGSRAFSVSRARPGPNASSNGSLQRNSENAETARSHRSARRSFSIASVVEVPGWQDPGADLQVVSTTRSLLHDEVLHPVGSLRRKQSVSTNYLHTSPSRSFSDKVMAYKLPNPSSVPAFAEEKSYLQRSSLRGDCGNGAGCRPVRKDAKVQTVTKVVVVILDAERKPTLTALNWALTNVVQSEDEIVVLGLLKHVKSPMGNKMLADVQDKFRGVNQACLDLEIQRLTEVFERKLSDSTGRKESGRRNVKLTVRIAPGSQPRTVVVRELTALQATQAIFERNVVKDEKDKEFFEKHLSCYAVRMSKDGRYTETVRLVQVSQTSGTRALETQCSFSSVSTDQTRPESRSLWSKLTSFGSSRRSSQRSFRESPSPKSVLPSAGHEDTESSASEMPEESISFDSFKDPTGVNNLPCKVKSFHLSPVADILDLPSRNQAAEEDRSYKDKTHNVYEHHKSSSRSSTKHETVHRQSSNDKHQ